MPVLALGAEHTAKDRPFATMRSSATLQAGTDLLGSTSGVALYLNRGLDSQVIHDFKYGNYGT